MFLNHSMTRARQTAPPSGTFGLLRAPGDPYHSCPLRAATALCAERILRGVFPGPARDMIQFEIMPANRFVSSGS